MNKTIKFSYEGIDYTLEFTKRTEKIMEGNGFIIAEVGDRPQTLLPELFAGSFLANHRATKRELIDRIFEEISDKEALFQKLGEMYNEPMNALLEAEGNLKWEASF